MENCTVEENAMKIIKQDDEIKDKVFDGNKELTIDQALEFVGGFGRFQILAQLIVSFAILATSYQSQMNYFAGDDPSWKCTSRNSSNFCHDNFGREIIKSNENFTQRCHLERHEWTYTTDIKYSYATEFDLVCSRTFIAAFAGGVFHIGGSIGVFVAGIIADSYGRKLAMILHLSLNMLNSIGCCFVKNTIQLILSRLLLGITGWPIYTICFSYIAETVTPKYRPITGNMIGLGLSISYMLFCLSAYFIRFWRTLQFYASFPTLLAIVVSVFLPESPRWHLSNSKNKTKAEDVIRKIGKCNGYTGNEITLLENVDDKTKHVKHTYFDLFCDSKVLLLTLILGLAWLTAGLSYYMITFESSNIGGNMYFSYTISTLFGFPCNFIANFPLNRFGRKRFIVTCFIVTGLLAGTITTIPDAFAFKYPLKMALVGMGNFVSFSLILGMFVWTFDIYPTSVRLQGWGICIAFERFGAASAPFLTTVLHQYNWRLPYWCALVLCFISAAGCIFLPETNNMKTREEFSDFFTVVETKTHLKINGHDNSVLDVEDLSVVENP